METVGNKVSCNKRKLVLTFFVLAKLLLQFIIANPYYDLHRDEYLHLDQGKHLAWGYLSVPPVTSWISYIIGLFGEPELLVKFFPALFGALTIVVVWKTIEELKGNLFALTLGAACILFSALLRLNFLYQPNSPDVLCWVAFYYFSIRYINTGRQKWLLFCSVIFALGFLNKYNIVFLAMGLLPAVLITKQREIFTRRSFYIAVLLAFLMILPNLLWQYNNGFPVFYHLRQLADTQLANVSRGQFLKEQVIYFIGSLPVIATSLYALLFYRPFRKYILFFWSFLSTLTIFLVFKAKGYYAIGLYPVYIAFGAVFLEKALNSGIKRYFRLVLIAIPVVLSILIANFIMIEDPEAVFKNRDAYRELGMLRWEDGKEHELPQDYADMLGWKELATKVDAAYGSFPATSHTLVLCDNYGQAGAINYYSRNRNINAVSFNADYINWFGLDRPVDNVIRVKECNNSSGELAETSPFFDAAYKADSVTNRYAREYRTTIFVFTGPKIDINKRLKAEIEEEKWH
ncbi:glycosyl transferase [Flavobacterium album]|uniref:Glycosyl transferase n=1 Tax=Flavobacterium album TaxID=2175091 RepID=A0A2S1QYB6_9FLAO|nr:glycosyltransferase family 39 protein [Flavobacterium album]AWH85241.1 glycosyl transferase [Flavobacterium album]